MVAVCCSSDCEIVGALAQLVEQPRVLDGNHGLGGEIQYQCDLLVGEGSHLLTIDNDDADQAAPGKHRHGEQAADAAGLHEACSRLSRGACVSTFCEYISDLDRCERLAHHIQRVTFLDSADHGVAFFGSCVVLRGIVQRNRAEVLALAKMQNTKFGFAKTDCVAEDGLKYAIEVAARCADSLKHIVGRLQLFPQLAELACP